MVYPKILRTILSLLLQLIVKTRFTWLPLYLHEALVNLFFFKTPEDSYIEIAYQPSNPTEGFSEKYEDYQTFHQIISTFKFLDQNQASSSAN